MRTVRATELKANLSSILGDVERGETVLVERHGKVVGKIVPADDDKWRRRQAAIEALLENKKTGRKTGITVEDILSAKNEGRP